MNSSDQHDLQVQTMGLEEQGKSMRTWSACLHRVLVDNVAIGCDPPPVTERTSLKKK